MERHHLRAVAIDAEWMEVGVSDTRPVAKFDAELEAALGATDEIVLIDSQCAVEQPDRRNCRLADADGADIRRLDQADRPEAALKLARQDRGGHPTGGAAPDDRDAVNALSGHRALAPSRRWYCSRKR